MPSSLNCKTVAEAQASDPELPNLINNEKLSIQALEMDGHIIHCDISTGSIRPYLPNSLRKPAFNLLHNLAHPGVRATVRLITEKYIWPGIRKDVARWAQHCEPCQRSKVHRHNRAALGSFKQPDDRFDHIHVDIIKLPLTQSFQYCLTIIDRFTRWPQAIAIPDMRASTIAKAMFKNWICTFGTPLDFTSDQGKQFESALFVELGKLIGANRDRTSSYHPQSDGMIERLHRTLKAGLMCDPSIPWPDRIPSVLLGLRTSFKEDLQASPAEMLFGTTIRVPGDFFSNKKNVYVDPPSFVENLRRLTQSIKPVPASRHLGLEKPFIFRDLPTCSHVFRRIDSVRKPLDPPYSGPHRVIRRINDRNYVIDINGNPRTYSTDALKPAYLEAADLPRSTAGPCKPKKDATTNANSKKTATTTKRVSFCSSSSSNTGRGVAVAVRTPRPRELE